MADTIKVPGIGPVDQRWVVASGALVAGIVGFAWWHRGVADAAAAEEQSATDPAFGDGSAEGIDDGAPWPFRPGVGGSTVDNTGAGGSAPTTNEQWTQEALDKLEAAGWDRQAAAVALGKYLARKPLKVPAETELVQTALALEGHPPQGSFSIIPDTPTAPPRPTPTPTPAPRPTPRPTPKPAPKPPAPKPAPKPATQYVAVRVVRWTAKNPPWNSTLSGIAAHYGKSWMSVWADPKNAPLVRLRKLPNRIQPGDTVYVRIK